jgi:uncharacterized protein (DUF486 family)
MNKYYLRSLILASIFFSFIFIAILKDISNYFGYLVLVALIVQGTKAIIDYLLELPMRVGYSRVLEPNEENGTGRIILLFLGIAMILFSSWWILTKPI